jgi:hypothetical protein
LAPPVAPTYQSTPASRAHKTKNRGWRDAPAWARSSNCQCALRGGRPSRNEGGGISFRSDPSSRVSERRRPTAAIEGSDLTCIGCWARFSSKPFGPATQVDGFLAGPPGRARGGRPQIHMSGVFLAPILIGRHQAIRSRRPPPPLLRIVDRAQPSDALVDGATDQLDCVGRGLGLCSPSRRASHFGSVRSPSGGLYFRRGMIERPSSAGPIPILARASILEPQHPYFVADHTIPKTGADVNLRFRRTRWSNGSTLLWLAHRTQVGRGPGCSGLAFDLIEAMGTSPPQIGP